MGFDKVRLYLINPKEKVLKGEIAYDLRGNFDYIEKEKYSLIKNSHPLVDYILEDAPFVIRKSFHDVVVSVPLKIKNRIIGLMVIDNILSQQKITAFEIQTIQSFAGQIAMSVENARLFEKVEELSVTDSLTGLFVRRHFKEKLASEMYRSRLYGTNLAIFILDIDDFKKINDNYGHPVGDKVLKEVAATIKSVLRRMDFACRYGGDEFIFCLHEITYQNSLKLGNRLINSIKDIKPTPEAKGIGTSIGVSFYPDDAQNLDSIISAADKALYSAKKHGKNQIHGIWEQKNK